MVRLSNVCVSFNRQTILDHVNLEIEAGEFVSLVGTTGSGKSTLLRLLYMDLFPETGSVMVGKFSSSTISSKQIPILRRKLGVVFQDFKLLEDRSVYDNVAFSLYVTNTRAVDIKKKVLNVLPTSVSATSATACRISFQEASSSGSPSRARSLTSRSSFWPMSPPATLTPQRRSTS